MTATAERVERLNRASLKRVIEPDVDLPGALGDGQLMPDELLSTAGLDLDLTVDQRRTLSREEVASMFSAGIRFEAILEMGFARQVAYAPDLTDPRVTYLLHEMGEETRHQRVFARLVSQIDPQASNPLDGKVWVDRLDRFGSGWITRHPAMLYVLVLAGEEIPDRMQKLASEHPDTDPFLAEVNRYHRQEEARHLSFAHDAARGLGGCLARGTNRGASHRSAGDPRPVPLHGATRGVCGGGAGRVVHVEAGQSMRQPCATSAGIDPSGSGRRNQCGHSATWRHPPGMAEPLRSRRTRHRRRGASGRRPVAKSRVTPPRLRPTSSRQAVLRFG